MSVLTALVEYKIIAKKGDIHNYLAVDRKINFVDPTHRIWRKIRSNIPREAHYISCKQLKFCFDFCFECGIQCMNISRVIT